MKSLVPIFNGCMKTYLGSHFTPSRVPKYKTNFFINANELFFAIKHSFFSSTAIIELKGIHMQKSKLQLNWHGAPIHTLTIGKLIKGE